jgi:organic radical activating enzyme
MKSPIKIQQKKPTINIYWKLTDLCNFKCNYCLDSLHSGNYATGKIPGFSSTKDNLYFLNTLKQHVNNGKHLNLQFSGGEPTLHPDFIYMIKSIYSNNVHIGVITNGSRGEDWWQEAINYIDTITISLHPGFTNIDKINAIGNLIINANKNLIFNLSLDPTRWDDILKMYNDIDDHLKPFISLKILNHLDTTKENYTYSQEQYKWIKLNSNQPMVSNNKFINSTIHFNDGSSEPVLLSRITFNKWNNFKNWRCKVSSQSLLIDVDGMIYAGICKVRHLGHLTNFNLLADSVICPFSFCPCPTDIRSEKNIE